MVFTIAILNFTNAGGRKTERMEAVTENLINRIELRCAAEEWEKHAQAHRTIAKALHALAYDGWQRHDQIASQSAAKARDIRNFLKGKPNA